MHFYNPIIGYIRESVKKKSEITRKLHDDYNANVLREGSAEIRMKKKESKAWRQLCISCRLKHLNETDLCMRAKLLLMMYRNVCWAASGRAEGVKSSLQSCCGNSLDAALSYLEAFAPDQEKEVFEERIYSLFETRWLVSLIEETMQRVKEYPDYGEYYFRILSGYYLSCNPYTDAELMERLGMERSTYYERKKEAVLVFALALWGVVLPQVKGNSNQISAKSGRAV